MKYCLSGSRFHSYSYHLKKKNIKLMIASNCVDIDHLKFGKYWFSSRYTIERKKIGLNEIPPPQHSLGGYIGVCLSVSLSGPSSTSFVRFPPNFVEFKIMMCERCSIKDFIVHWVLPLFCLFGLRYFETIQYALCYRKFSYMINQKFMKLCILQDPNMKMSP